MGDRGEKETSLNGTMLSTTHVAIFFINCMRSEKTASIFRL